MTIDLDAIRRKLSETLASASASACLACEGRGVLQFCGPISGEWSEKCIECDSADNTLPDKSLASLIEEVERLQKALDTALGPTCLDCGNLIDPDTCHCGSAVDAHGQMDNHTPVPMGCACYSEPDWKKIAIARKIELYRRSR